jgi:hypothetical protein
LVTTRGAIAVALIENAGVKLEPVAVIAIVSPAANPGYASEIVPGTW